MYYTLDADGKIKTRSNYVFAPDAIETDREIVQGYDGRLYFAGDEPAQPQAEIEAQRKATLDAAIADRLDKFARLKEYATMDKARLAALSTDFASDGHQAQAAYDATWTAAIPLFPQVMAGTLSIEDAVGQLPALAWT